MMAQPRTLEQLEKGLFREGPEREFCMTAIWCEDCPKMNDPECPAITPEAEVREPVQTTLCQAA